MGGSSGIKIIDDINPFHEGSVTNNAANEVQKFVGQQGDAFYRVAKAPAEIAIDVARGDIKHAVNVGGQAVGGAVTMAGGGTGYLSQTRTGEQIYQNKYVDKFTGGLSGDYYGTVKGGNQLRTTGQADQEYWDDAARLGIKAAVIGGASAAYSSYESAASVGGSSLPSIGVKDALIYGSAGQQLLRGDVKGALQTAGGADNSWLPKVPDAPSWLPDFSGLLNDLLPGASPAPGSTGVQESSPWSFGGVADGGISSPAQIAGVSVLAIAGVVGAVYLLKKKRVI